MPKGWHLCDGATLLIAQNQALYALLGTRYGGDGKTNFCLPDLRGRVPLAMGVGPDNATYSLGNQGGQEGVALTADQMPTHNHSITCSSQAASSNQPQGNRLAAAPTGKPAYVETTATVAKMADSALATAGLSAAHNNMQPSLAVNFCIAVQGGLFPPRS